MNEETIQYKISVPLINDEELRTIDNYYNEIVDEFVKESVKEKDDIITQRIMMNLRKENKQLKQQLEQRDNIINKAREIVENKFLETWLESFMSLETENYLKLKEILNINKGEII